MKIVIVGTAYPMRGGIAQFNALLFKYLSEKAEIMMFSFKRQYPEFLFPGKTQYETGKPAVDIPGEKNFIKVDSINPFNWLINGYRISKLKPDLLIFKYWIPFFAPCFFVISFIAKSLSRSKVLFICDNVIPHEKRIGDDVLTKLAFSQADFFVVMSKKVETDLKKFSGTKPFKFLHHPVYNLFGEKIDKTEAKKFISEKYNIKCGDNGIVLFFGYIRKYKGVDFLIESGKFIKDKVNAKILIVGESYESTEKYHDRIKELNLENEVIFISDFIPDEDVKYFFSASDVVVLPYIDATQSGIIQIAYFYDKPVIATDVGGLSEVVINNETGLVIKPSSPEEIAGAVINFYENKLEYKFSDNIKLEKKKYMWEKFTDEVISLAEN